MDKMQRRAHTAPIKLHSEVDKQSVILRELQRYEVRIADAHRTVKHTRAKAHGPMYQAEARGQVDIAATAGAVIADMGCDVDMQKINTGKYIVKKLLLAAKAGIIDESLDSELQQLRRMMRTSLFKP